MYKAIERADKFDLHSTVVLLKVVHQVLQSLEYLHLHSTVVLLNAYCMEIKCPSSKNLHSTVVLLKVPNTKGLLLTGPVFTFYCSSIKGNLHSTKSFISKDLHSTVVLLKALFFLLF